ncbi:hypothetical protein GAY28_06490 [Azospirillum brasilense]|nr:hypothetical protein [Azospirillum brasilense]
MRSQPARSSGGVVVRKVARGSTLLSECTGAPIARLRPTGNGDTVHVLWSSGERWGASSPPGIVTMGLTVSSTMSPTSRTSG